MNYTKMRAVGSVSTLPPSDVSSIVHTLAVKLHQLLNGNSEKQISPFVLPPPWISRNSVDLFDTQSLRKTFRRRQNGQLLEHACTAGGQCPVDLQSTASPDPCCLSIPHWAPPGDVAITAVATARRGTVQ